VQLADLWHRQMAELLVTLCYQWNTLPEAQLQQCIIIDGNFPVLLQICRETNSVARWCSKCLWSKQHRCITDVPFEAFGSTSYPPFAFVEAAVNIGAILTGSCQTVNIKTIFVSTKASDSYSRCIKRFC
jgi:hypothetical protein